MSLGKVDSRRESGVGSDSDTMAELTILLTTEIPEGRSNLADSHTNLGKVFKFYFALFQLLWGLIIYWLYCFREGGRIL